MGVLADIQSISEFSAKLATDQAALNVDMEAVTAQQELVANDTTASSTADAQLSGDLQAGGPRFVANADGSVSVYAWASTPPGYTITPVQPAN